MRTTTLTSTTRAIALAVSSAMPLLGCARAPEGALDARAPLRDGSFSAPDDDGALARVPGERARATVLEFWSPHCGPCQLMLSALALEAPRLRAEGVALVPVAVLDGGETISAARDVLRAWGIERAFLVDRGGGVQRTLGLDGVPAVVVLDRRGGVRWVAPADATPGRVIGAALAVARRPSPARAAPR